MVFFYRTSHTPTTVNNHITTKHKASLILGSDIKAAPLSCWECPKAAIAVFGEGSVEKGRTRLHLHQHLLLQKPHPQSLRSTIIKEFHVGRSKENRLGSFPLHLGMHPLFRTAFFLLPAPRPPLLQHGRFCISLRDCCCLPLSLQPWQVWLSSAALCLAPLQLAGLLFPRGFSLGPWPCTTACTFQALL